MADVIDQDTDDSFLAGPDRIRYNDGTTAEEHFDKRDPNEKLPPLPPRAPDGD